MTERKSLTAALRPLIEQELARNEQVARYTLIALLAEVISLNRRESSEQLIHHAHECLKLCVKRNAAGEGPTTTTIQ